MNKMERYRETLKSLTDWEEYLMSESNLPGPRGNLELVAAVVAEGTPDRFEKLRMYTADRAPENTPESFLCVCGVAGLGKLLAEGQFAYLPELRRYASDPRWRTREAVVMALEKLGRADMDRLLEEMNVWGRGTLLERRAAVAGLCQPEILDEENVLGVLEVLGMVTASLLNEPDRKCSEFKTLRKALGYCWSVAVIFRPEIGKAAFEKWFDSPDPDIRWVVKENLRKKRLERMDAAWLLVSQKRLGLV